MAEPTAIQVILDLNGWQVLACLFKTLTYGSSFACSGGVLFLAWFSPKLSCTEAQTIKRFILCMTASAITFSVIRIALINGMLSGELSEMFNLNMTKVVLNSSEGTSTCLRLAGLIAIAILCRSRMQTIERRFAVCGAIIVSTSFAWVGHTNEVIEKYGGSLFPEGLLILHLIAVSLWLGSLWPLRILTYGDDPVRVAAIIHRFGQLITVVVALLIVAGSSLLWMIVGQPDALFFSAYGQMAVVKIIWVALLLTIAMINKFWLTPLLINGNSNTMTQLKYSINAEIAIAGIILLVTACFTTLVGPAESL